MRRMEHFSGGRLGGRSSHSSALGLPPIGALERQGLVSNTPQGQGRVVVAPAPSMPSGNRGLGGALSGAGKALSEIGGVIKQTRQSEKRRAFVEQALGLGSGARDDAMSENGGPTVDAAREMEVNKLDGWGIPDRAQTMLRGMYEAGDVDGAFDILSRFAFSPDKERKTLKGADGYEYYQDNGERVLPGVQKAPDPVSASDFVTLYDPNKPNALRTVKAGSDRFNALLERGWVKGTPPRGESDALTPVYDKESGAVSYASPREIRENRGRYAPVSAAPDGGKYRQRTRPVDDQSQVFEVSFDGGMTWEPQGNPVARSVDPTAALLSGLLGGGSLLDGQGQGGQPGVTQPVSAGPAASAPAGPPTVAPDLTPENVQATLDAARAAIENGSADRASVVQQLQAVGINPTLLDQ